MAQDKIGQQDGNGKIRPEDGKVPKNMEPAMGTGPSAAKPSRRKICRIKELLEKGKHWSPRHCLGNRKVTISLPGFCLILSHTISAFGFEIDFPNGMEGK